MQAVDRLAPSILRNANPELHLLITPHLCVLCCVLLAAECATHGTPSAATMFHIFGSIYFLRTRLVSSNNCEVAVVTAQWSEIWRQRNWKLYRCRCSLKNEARKVHCSKPRCCFITSSDHSWKSRNLSKKGSRREANPGCLVKQCLLIRQKSLLWSKRRFKQCDLV